MSPLTPRFRFFLPVVGTADSFVDPNTGSLSTRAGEGATSRGSHQVSVGGTFTIPEDVVALAVYATVDLSFETLAWAGFLGGSESRVSAAIALFNNRLGAAQILRTCETEVAASQAWIGSWGTGPRTRTLSLTCSVDWGQPNAMNTLWTAVVALFADAAASGIAGSRASIATTVRQIEYEMFWRA